MRLWDTWGAVHRLLTLSLAGFALAWAEPMRMKILIQPRREETEVSTRMVVHWKSDQRRDDLHRVGRGCGVGRGLGAGLGLGVPGCL